MSFDTAKFIEKVKADSTIALPNDSTESWMQIANEFGITPNEAKLKWKQLLTEYERYLCNYSTNFAYIAEMKFTQPFLLDSADSSDSDLNLTADDLYGLLQSDEEDNVKEVAAKKQSHISSFTPLELIFLGYARTLQALPHSVQLKTKRKIADIIHDAEMSKIKS